MAWTQTDIDRLKAAIASGIVTVSYDGPPRRTVQYQNTRDMLAALAVMEAEVAATTDTGRATSTVAAFSKGFRPGRRGSFRRNE